MEIAVTSLLALLALALFWTSAAKLLPESRLATSREMAWATRGGLASGTIAGVTELIAAAIFLLTLVGVIPVLLAVVAGIGVAAHMGVAASRVSEDDERSALPNWILGAFGLLVAVAPLVA